MITRWIERKATLQHQLAVKLGLKVWNTTTLVDTSITKVIDFGQKESADEILQLSIQQTPHQGNHR